jgi:hypothetical protein
MSIIVLIIMLVIIIVSIILFTIRENYKSKILLSLDQKNTNVTYPTHLYEWGGCSSNKPTKSTKFVYP